jgi:hypothetical protein
VKRSGLPIHKIKLRHTTETGIEVISIPGLISEFYEREACRFTLYRFETDWQELDYQQKAEAVAQYLLSKQIDSHVQDAEISKMENSK